MKPIIDSLMKPIIDIGDLNAPEGSTPWCQGWLQVLCRLKREGQSTISMLQLNLRRFRSEKLYKKLPDDVGEFFRTWEDFVQYREPYGLGLRVEIANGIIEERDDSRLVSEMLGHGGAREGAGRPIQPKGKLLNKKRNIQGSISNLEITRGDNPGYWLALLKRDRPDLKVTLKTATRIATELGWREKRKRRCPHCGHEW